MEVTPDTKVGVKHIIAYSLLGILFGFLSNSLFMLSSTQDPTRENEDQDNESTADQQGSPADQEPTQLMEPEQEGAEPVLSLSDDDTWVYH